MQFLKFLAHVKYRTFIIIHSVGTDKAVKLRTLARLLNFYTMQAINTLKKGDFFRFKGKKPVYIYQGYCRLNRAYESYKFDNINVYRYTKKGTLIETEFEF